jgi:hypothetical protein
MFTSLILKNSEYNTSKIKAVKSKTTDVFEEIQNIIQGA